MRSSSMHRRQKPIPAKRNRLAGITLRPYWESLEARLFLDASDALGEAAITFWAADSAVAFAADGPLYAAARTSLVDGPLATQPNGLPILNSLPGAATAIYIDFDGDAGQNITAYDTDGNPASFNAQEQADITEAWRQMSLYFAMFDTNVTTIRPTVPMAWDIIGNNTGGGTGGYAYIGTFPNSSPQAFNASDHARGRVSGMAHEVGHVFGLGHQSSYDLLGEKTAEYAGKIDDLHGQLMGVDYAGLVHKWTLSHPASSASMLQSDVQVIADKIKAYQTGPGVHDGFRADDYSNLLNAPAPLKIDGLAQTAWGIIERISDFDFFSFSTAGGPLDIHVSPDSPSGVDLKLSIFTTDGTLLASSDNADLAQQFTLDLLPGTYVAQVAGHGNYGDLGAYNLWVRPLPDGWHNQDIGFVGKAGYANYDPPDQSFSVSAAGADIWDSSDSFNYLYQTLRGDGSITVRVNALSASNDWAKAGPMIRETLADNSKDVAMLATWKGGPQMLWRSSTAGSTTGYYPSTSAFSPIWLRLERSGSTFRGYRSTDGVNFSLYSSTTVSMASQVYIGLALTSHDRNDLAEATFDNLSFTGDVGDATPAWNSLPAPSGLTLAVSTGSGIRAVWQAVDSATGYLLERSDNGVDWSRVGTTAGDVLEYSDENILGSMRYFYRISAIDPSGQSAPSAPVSIINRPSPVTGLTITSLNTSTLVLNWKDSDGETRYRIERSTDGVNFTTVGQTPYNYNSYTDSNLQQATQYTYRVIALSAPGDSLPSTIASGWTRLPAVQGLAFDVIEFNRIQFHWSDAADEAGYRVERSTDGVNWSTLTSLSANTTTYIDTTVKPVSEYYYRVVATKGSGSATAVSINSSVIFAATPGAALRAPWSAKDIGTITGAGAAQGAGANFTIIAGGNDIWGSADSFRFMYQPLIGDGEIYARVATLENTDGWAKAGVMIRESLASNSKHAMVVLTPDNGANMQYRVSTGGQSNTTAAPGTKGSAPYWVRLVRQGNAFTGYARADNGTWTLIATQNISMTSTVYIGLALTAHDSSELNTTTFDNVTVSNREPSVSTAPAASPNPLTGRETTLSVLGADDHGEENLRYTWSIVSAPEGAPNPIFALNYSNASKNTTATFFRAGTYVLRVTLADLSNATASADVTITVLQTLTDLSLQPESASILTRQTVQFTATSFDQFGDPMQNPPAAQWSVELGGGSIGGDGLYTAGEAAGDASVKVSVGTLSETSLIHVDPSITPPAAPTLIAAQLLDGPTIQFTWQDQSDNEEGFRLERSINGGPFELISETATNLQQATDSTPITGGAIYRLSSFAGPYQTFASAVVAALVGTSDTDTFSINAGSDLSIAFAANPPAIWPAQAVTSLIIAGAGGTDELNVIAAPDAAISSLSLSGNVRLNLTGAESLVLPALSIVSGSRLDLATTDLRIRNGDYAALAALVASARDADPRWTGPGIGTSSANADQGLAIGIIGSDVKVKFTWNGDLNFDGRVNADDYFYIDSGFLQKPVPPAYQNGDFNFDGRINADDYFLIDQAFLNQKGTTLSSPKPALSTRITPKRLRPSVFSRRKVSYRANR